MTANVTGTTSELELAVSDGQIAQARQGLLRALRPGGLLSVLPLLGGPPLIKRTNQELQRMGKEIAWGDVDAYARRVEVLEGEAVRGAVARHLSPERAVIVRVIPSEMRNPALWTSFPSRGWITQRWLGGDPPGSAHLIRARPSRGSRLGKSLPTENRVRRKGPANDSERGDQRTLTWATAGPAKSCGSTRHQRVSSSPRSISRVEATLNRTRLTAS